MALQSCPDCRADVSTAAPACPRCGRPIRTFSWARVATALALTVIALPPTAYLLARGLRPVPVPRRATVATAARPPVATVPDDFPPGAHARIWTPDGHPACLASHVGAYEELGAAQAAGSEDLVERLVANRAAVRERNNVEVLVVKAVGAARFVRVLRGEHDDFEGWIHQACLVPMELDLIGGSTAEIRERVRAWRGE